MSHTPGPWTVTDVDTQYARAFVQMSDGSEISGSDGVREVESLSIADAHLIAAAPELLAACQRALAYIEYLDPVNTSSPSGIVVLLRAAIANAEGREP